MHPYVLLVAAACLTSAACAGFSVARSSRRPPARLVAAIFFATAWWALCDVATCLVSSREAALAWMRAAVPGWIFLGPLVLHFCTELAGNVSPRTVRLRPPKSIPRSSASSSVCGASSSRCRDS